VNVADLAFGTPSAKSVTVSFWVKSSITGNFGVSIRNNAINRSYPSQYTIDAANTWEYKTVTISGDVSGSWTTNTSVGIYVTFDLGSGANVEGALNTWGAGNYIRVSGQAKLVQTTGATWQVTGVQLESGTSPTMYDFRPYQVELALCQRYYETSYPSGTAVGGASDGSGAIVYVALNTSDFYTFGSFRFSVKKRASPTVTLYNPVTGTAGQLRGYSDSSNGATTTIEYVNDSGVGRVGCASNNMTTNFVYGFHFAASAEL
jgi:hypothetical protein